MSRWWRAYDEAVDDPKLILLSDKAHRAWFNLMCIASLHGGVLPDIKIVAVKLRVSVQRAAASITELVQAGLFDLREDGKFEPHNWELRQFKSDVTDPTAAERMRNYRNRRRNSGVTVTVPREQNTETEAEKKKDTSLRSDDWPTDFGDQFWQAYPRKTEKLAAMKGLSKVRNSGLVTFADLIAGVRRYAKAVSSNDPQYTKQPTVWLNKGCWADETMPGESKNGHRSGNPRASGHDALLAVATGKARELDRDDAVAGPDAEAGFAFGDGADGPGPQGSSGAAGSDQHDYYWPESDCQGVREGEIIPPDQNVVGLSWRR